MNKRIMNEGSIDVRDTVVKVMLIVKETIRGLYNKRYVKGGIIGVGKEVKEDEFKNILKYINYEIRNRLKDSGVIGCDILFVMFLKDGESLGGYSETMKIIVIDGYEYLTEYDEDKGVQVYKSFNNIRFDKLSRTVEHELIHHEQDKRSGGKLFTNSKKGVTEDEIKEFMKKKDKIAPWMSDELYIKRIKYYNSEHELDTFANNVADMYVQYKVNQMRRNISSGNKNGGEVRNYSAKEVRDYVLGDILSSSGERFGMKLGIYQKLVDMSDGYKFLTISSKKKYWKYLFKALMVNRFEPMIFVK